MYWKSVILICSPIAFYLPKEYNLIFDLRMIILRLLMPIFLQAKVN